ncbi:hypothetical protein [Streptomyces sp. NPDC058045]|uniref:DUF7919 family protein n=1 Tax=Streptomyces sp. NPDC058045 TaxID=3346311 RepID=UPI0036EF71B4
MTYYEDLSVYDYFSDSIPEGVSAFNVGWLEAGRGYVKGGSSESFLECLETLVRDSGAMRTRGWESCQIPHPESGCPYPVTVGVSGGEVILGDAEIRVVAQSGDWLIAPNLILHYVREHSYSPPDVFVEAVLAGRVAG